MVDQWEPTERLAQSEELVDDASPENSTPVVEESADEDVTPRQDATGPEPAEQVAESDTQASDPVADALNLVSGQITQFRDQLERHHDRSTAQEDLIARMQQQIESLRADQVRALLKPVLIVLADLHAEAVSTAAEDVSGWSARQVSRTFDYFAQLVEQAIAQLGFDAIGVESGQEFDPRQHTASSKVPTPDPALARHIARVVRQGFRAPEDATPALYAKVTVYRHEAPALSETPAAPPGPSTGQPTPVQESDPAGTHSASPDPATHEGFI